MYNDKAEENIKPGSIASTISQRIQEMFIWFNLLRKLCVLVESNLCYEK